MSTVLLDELLSAINGDHSGFNARLREAPYVWSEDGLTVSGKFFYLAFRDGHHTLDEFAQVIYQSIIPFCISRKERREKGDKFKETNEYRYMHELTDKARDLFIKAKESKKTSGEPGELILFMLLEEFLKAPQLACKMSLKTSEHMPVHGSDAIHIARGSRADSICLIWGESKIYKQLSNALDEVCNSISAFLTEKEGRTARDRDIDIIMEHMNIEDPDWREVLLEYFDPYSEQGNKREEAYACFVGFDYAGIYNQLQTMSASEREEFFKKEYLMRIETACQLFGQKLKDKGLLGLRINYFLIPFPSVEDLRTKFFNHLGITP